jgi:hypothetical protein
MRHPSLDVEEETQWRVTWFPPDRAEVVRTGNERQVRYQAEQNAAWNPIVEKRQIIVTDWVDADAEEAADVDEA